MRGFTLFPILALFYAFQSLVVNAVQPNIIVIISDDQRWDASGYMQSRFLEEERIARFPWLIGTTPNLDRLSTEGFILIMHSPFIQLAHLQELQCLQVYISSRAWHYR